VRVRIAGETAVLSIKGETVGATRQEFEVAIARAAAEEILHELCLRPLIEKTRHRLEHGSHEWVVDEFHGAHEGSWSRRSSWRASSTFERPGWLGKEVTNDPRYYNTNLVRNAAVPEDSS